MKKTLVSAFRVGSKTVLEVQEESSTLEINRGDGLITFKVDGQDAHILLPKNTLDPLEERTANIEFNIKTKNGKAK
jgi:hypothetical protein